MRNLILKTFLLVLLIHPLSLLAQNSFSLSLDVDGSAGDQAVTSVDVSTDETVAIQIFGKDIQNANGLAVRFEYHASQVAYEGFDVGDVLPNAQALPEQGTGFVEIGIASLGNQATANSGLVGTVRFRATAAFSGTTIRLVRAELSRGGQFETVTLNTRVELQFQVVTPDFDGDGRVGFADFLAFAGQFGARQGDGRYEAKYDLDSDGAIGFGDFLIFGRSFGQEVSTPNGGNGREETQITIPDANLRAVIEDSLGKASGAPITRADMATLTSLTAPKKDILDLTGLEFATGLASLDISDNAISDISVLANLTNLRYLNLRSNFISDLSLLSGLTKLIQLYLSDNLITDISALSGLTNLRTLRLSSNLFTDISATISLLSGMTNLRSLALDDNLITDISLLSSLTNLTWLTLDGNKISDVSALSGLTSLGYLSLRGGYISDVSALANLTNLWGLKLSGNTISDISPLADLTSLKTLELFHNLIMDISPLSSFTSLRFLQLGSNLITDISALSSLTSLEYLGLYDNLISDIAPLVANRGLGSGDYVTLRNNPLSATSINTYIPALQGRGVDVGFSASKPGVEEIEPGSRL